MEYEHSSLDHAILGSDNVPRPRAAAQSERDAQKGIRSVTFIYGRHADFECFVEPLTGTERGRSEYPEKGAFCAQDSSEVSEQPIPL